jgi:hypothetical protein
VIHGRDDRLGGLARGHLQRSMAEMGIGISNPRRCHLLYLHSHGVSSKIEIGASPTDLGRAEGGGRSEHWSSQMGRRGGDVWYACRSHRRQSQAPRDGEARRCSSFLIFGSDRLSDSLLHARALSHNSKFLFFIFITLSAHLSVYHCTCPKISSPRMFQAWRYPPVMN